MDMDEKTKPAKPDDQESKAAPKREEPSAKPEEQSVKEEESFDFGGLPKRDLKKNLGCG